MNWQVFRAHVFPLVRPLVIRWGAALLLLALAWAALLGVQRYYQPDWAKAQAQAQAAQAQWNEARDEQDDLIAHGATFEQLKAAGLVGTDPRAIWVDELLRSAREQGLQERIAFTLAAPEALAMRGAEAVPAQVKRHGLEYTLSRVHDIEALQFIQRFHRAHARTARPMACRLEQPTPTGLTARCRVNFLHIDPAPAGDHNQGS